MKKCLLVGMVLTLFISLAGVTGCVEARPPAEEAAPAEEETVCIDTSLRSLAQVHNMQVGAAVQAGLLATNPRYAETLRCEFSMLVPENAMKFEHVHPGRDRYDFSTADAIVDFAEANGMQVRGHTLVWHSQLPDWLTEGNWTRDELIKILQEHIMTVVGHYQGRIVAWDVVNEAVDDGGSLRDTFWLQGIGEDYIKLAFCWAHEADPEALLFYNDYGGEGLEPKSDTIYELIQSLLDEGVPIHGVGLQMHLSLDSYPKAQDVATNLNRLSVLGLEAHITEMDVRIQQPVTEEKLNEQARVYRDMLQVCLSAQNCRAFVLWGVTDHYSWVPLFFPGYQAALIFDENCDPKPAYYALTDVLAGH